MAIGKKTYRGIQSRFQQKERDSKKVNFISIHLRVILLMHVGSLTLSLDIERDSCIVGMALSLKEDNNSAGGIQGSIL